MSDESAKANLNQLQRVIAWGQFQAVLSSLPPGATHRECDLIESFGQLFGSMPAFQLIDETTSLTCWDLLGRWLTEYSSCLRRDFR